MLAVVYTDPDDFGFFEPSFPRVEIFHALSSVDGLFADKAQRYGGGRVDGFKLGKKKQEITI